MKAFTRVIFVLLLLSLLSCGNGSKKSDSQESENNEAQLESCVDYKVVDEDDPRTYWDVFVADVLCTKGSPDYGQLNTNVNIFLVEQSPEEYASGVSPDHAGFSTYSGYCNNSRVNIGVIKQYWEDYTDIQKLWLMYHEFGHDVYRFAHSESSRDEIMWPSVPAPNVTMNDFIKAKNNLINNKFEGIKYIPCNISN